MRYFLLTIILIFLNPDVFSQDMAMVWYFGNKAGIDFNSGEPEILNNGGIVAEAGCASICDKQGNLLFYTNGNKVWNKNHSLMLNGDTINGSQLLNQNSIIVPKPLCDSIYYLFTLNNNDTLRGFNYSVININRGDGLGEIVEKNVEVSKNVLEKITAIAHCNGRDYWIITHGKSNSFYNYLLSDEGFIFDTIKSKVGTIPKADIGYLKVSPAGNKIIIPVNRDSILAEVFNFNNKTGKITHPIKILAKQENTYCYGVEFSPNGNLLYISTGGKKYEVLQYDLRLESETNINRSPILISIGNNFAMQLAPDSKIYIASENRPYLNAINFPNKIDYECGYEAEAIKFTQSYSLMGLPNFVQSWFYKPSLDVENTCFLDSTLFTFNQYQNVDSLSISFGDEFEYIYNLNQPFSTYYQFEKPGIFNIELNIFHCGVEKQIVQQTEIFPYPVSPLVDDTIICKNCSLVLDAGEDFDYYLWDDDGNNRYYTVYESGVYYVEIGKNGCFTSDSVRVKNAEPFLIFPNAFTPNGDGLNDEFKVLNPDRIVDFNMWIYTRRGEIVYQSNDVYEGWNGKYNGEYSRNVSLVWNVTYTYFNEKGLLVEESKRGMITVIR